MEVYEEREDMNKQLRTSRDSLGFTDPLIKLEKNGKVRLKTDSKEANKQTGGGMDGFLQWPEVEEGGRQHMQTFPVTWLGGLVKLPLGDN